ncbi:MAG: hypothetical protein ACI94Y_003773 [Maribacter sp.]|jgi:hypothetical protein
MPSTSTSHTIHPVIIIIAYNRTSSLQRLLEMVFDAVYYTEVDLVISIDKSDNEEIIPLASAFDWQYGKKRIITHQKNMGLKKHVLSCGDLTEKYGAVIILEDDLLVSKDFYQYAQKAISYYQAESKVAGISLYSPRITESSLSPFDALNNGMDTYFMSLPASWGQAWTAGQWMEFKRWLENWDNEFKHIPTYIRYWSAHSWKKIFVEYLLEKNKYFVYPRDSYTTNPGEIGTNYSSKVEFFKTPLSLMKDNISFADVENKAMIYDASFEIDPDILKRNNSKLSTYDFSVDLHGGKTPEEISTEYVLTTQKCTRSILTFSNQLFPLETNIINDEKGSGISLCKTKDMKFGCIYRLQNRLRPYYYTRSKLRNKLNLMFFQKK